MFSTPVSTPVCLAITTELVTRYNLGIAQCPQMMQVHQNKQTKKTKINGKSACPHPKMVTADVAQSEASVDIVMILLKHFCHVRAAQKDTQ